MVHYARYPNPEARPVPAFISKYDDIVDQLFANVTEALRFIQFGPSPAHRRPIAKLPRLLVWPQYLERAAHDGTGNNPARDRRAPTPPRFCRAWNR
jgi:hypothetical protein